MFENFIYRIAYGTGSSPEKILCLIIAIVFSIASVGLIWPKLDMEPATPEDFKQLYEYLNSIQGKPENFLNRKGDITIEDDRIVYKIENEQCKMTGVFDKDYKLIYTSEEDKYIELFKAIISTIFVAVFVFLICMVTTYVVIAIIEFLIICSLMLIKKIFTFKR